MIAPEDLPMTIPILMEMQKKKTSKNMAIENHGKTQNSMGISYLVP